MKDFTWTRLQSADNCIPMDLHKQTLSALGNSPARRSLFGPVDREQLQVEYQAALRRDLDQACQRWGFDFVSDKPLEQSVFQWEGIPGSEVPLLYRSCLPGLGHTEGQRAAEADLKPRGRGRVGQPHSEEENIHCSPERCELHPEKTPERREDTGLKRKQTNITDFYQSKRRFIWTPRKSGE
ncbi:cyclin-dependent kinase inhibitor 1 isoform X1 [Trematomus bernacchii]|uniref:cyclin-dependent kinase inhibitor 1 isoform X1 n=1 Tax=Trematomus bernacchii TaxID=40690 RepID=UPI00146E6F89|nr:cyclin-dependent kinase inhibitor 1 isoform X1 [Trematomus bernacchii]